MEKEIISQYKEKKIKIFLRNGDIFVGKIVQVLDESFIFLDRFNAKIPIDYRLVEMIKPHRGEPQ